MVTKIRNIHPYPYNSSGSGIATYFSTNKEEVTLHKECSNSTPILFKSCDTRLIFVVVVFAAAVISYWWLYRVFKGFCYLY